MQVVVLFSKREPIVPKRTASKKMNFSHFSATGKLSMQCMTTFNHYADVFKVIRTLSEKCVIEQINNG